MILIKTFLFKILLHEKGYKVDVKHYETLKHRLSDDFDQVRLLSIKLIWALAMTYPEQYVIQNNYIQYF